MPEASLAYRRHAVGIIGLLLISIGVYFWCNPPSEGTGNFIHGTCVKSGMVLLVIWLAIPKLDQMPIWSTIGVIATAAVLVLRPKVFAAALRFALMLLPFALLLVPVYFLIWVFKPPVEKPNVDKIASQRDET